MFNYDEATALSIRYEIPVEDVIMIAINRYGIVANIEDKRIRFKIKLHTDEAVYYCAVCVNTYSSPFYIDGQGILYLERKEIGSIFEQEKDTCDSTYFRRNKTALTLNSNKRSQCKGCTFCGTYNLDPDDNYDLNNRHSLSAYVEALLSKNSLSDLSDIVRITICTGCFESESALVEHILMVKEVFENYGFDKRIRYIGSQLRSDSAMKQISENLKAFSLTYTVECFSRRQEIMRKEKGDIDIPGIVHILQRALSYGFSTNYLYILGLESLEIMEDGMLKLRDSINRFPGIQIMQNFTEEQEHQRIPEAKEIDYYLKARKMIERMYEKEGFKPRLWENYRGLFYTSYNSKALKSIRI